jgi:hypothetical protein
LTFFSPLLGKGSSCWVSWLFALTNLFISRFLPFYQALHTF